MTNCEGCDARDEIIKKLSERIDELEADKRNLTEELRDATRPRPTLEPAAIDWGW